MHRPRVSFRPADIHRFIAGLLIGFALLITGCSTSTNELSRPILVAKNKDDSKIFIYDSRNYRFLVTDRKFHLLKTITHPYLYSIWGFCVTSKDEIAVANNRYLKASITEEERRKNSVAEILIFDLDGKLINQLPPWYAEKGPIITPSQIIEFGDEFLVTDIRLNKIFRLNRKGEIVSSWGEYGDEPGKMYYPGDIAIAQNGNLIEVDGYNSRIQIFSPDGKFQKVLVEKGQEEGKVMIPEYVSQDKQGNLYCGEFYSMRISVFNKDGQFLRSFFPQGPQKERGLTGINGILHLSNPDQLVVTDSLNSLLYVCDPASGTNLLTISGFDQKDDPIFQQPDESRIKQPVDSPN